MRIRDFTPGQRIQGFYLLVEKYARFTRNNEPYFECTLQDSTGTIAAKAWKDSEAFSRLQELEDGTPVVAKGTVSEYRGVLQLELQVVAPAEEEKHGPYGFKLEDLLPVTDKDREQLWQRLLELIDEISNPYLKQLCNDFLKRYESEIRTYPASKKLHHAVLGGYLEHVVSMLEIARFVAAHYQVDGDLLLAGVFCHDIGKLRELKPVTAPGYTDEGYLIGHIVIGWQMVQEVAQHIPDFPKELLLRLEHMVLSHQGKYEWQAPKQPKFLEAYLLHVIDEMDAKMNIFRNIMATDTQKGPWTDRHNYFRLPLLKGRLEPDEPDKL